MRVTLRALVVLAAIVLATCAGAVEPNKNDPLYQSKGDQKRSYKFPATGEMLPYRTYVPASWAPGKKMPLVLVLHGGGLDENAPFERTPAPMKDEVQKLAEEFGFIIVSPLGYGAGGGFGAPPPPGLALPPGSLDTKKMEYSAQDVMDTVEIVEKEYGVDPTKEFITGNSMGGIGTVYLAAKYPDKWLAMAPSEAGYQPARYGKDKFGVKGALFIHKQDDKAPQVETETAEMVKLLSAEGIDARTIAVPNTAHENVWFFALPVTFHFFETFVQGR